MIFQSHRLAALLPPVAPLRFRQCRWQYPDRDACTDRWGRKILLGLGCAIISTFTEWLDSWLLASLLRHSLMAL
jgi:hypothetical protein